MEIHPEIPEGINVSKTHPLVEFGFLLAAVALIILFLLLAAQIISGFMVKHISFEAERAIYERLTPESINKKDEKYTEQNIYLESLAQRLVEQMNLPDGMQVYVRYSDSDIANAYATLGGNIVIYQGMIDNISSENGLAMVLAHEIAHIKNRDPVMALGRGTVSLVGLALFSGLGDSSAINHIFNITGGGTLSKFSRDQESHADDDAVNAMLGLYGTTLGGDEFFINMKDKESTLSSDFFSTHPETDKRIERLKASDKADSDFKLTPLPPIFSQSSTSQPADITETSTEADIDMETGSETRE